jgi:hypothetical protein
MVVVINPSEGKPSMGKSIPHLSSVARVGLDLAKNAFRVHAVDAKGEIVVARKLASVKADETAKRLMTIPGVGPVTASAIMATVPHQQAADMTAPKTFPATSTTPLTRGAVQT